MPEKARDFHPLMRELCRWRPQNVNRLIRQTLVAEEFYEDGASKAPKEKVS